MSDKLDWFPVDTSLFPLDFSFKAPASRWARRALFLELALAFLSVIGTLILVVLPPPNLPLTTQAETQEVLTIPPGCRQ